MINENFVKNWIPKKKNSDEIEISKKKKSDEDEYDSILKKIQEQDSYIDWKTFERIYNWKASRSKNYLDTKNKELYISAFKEISDLDDVEKINFFKQTKQRKKLPGILEPIASTILHFKYPDKFPIMDVRTVGTLRDKGLLKAKKISYENYRAEIFKIYDNCKKEFSLREIDKALFTYNEQKELLLRVLEGKKSLTDVAKHLKIPQERKMELILDLENKYKESLVKLNNLKNELSSLPLNESQKS